ncbi:MAG: hypothetical protein JRM72_01730 [Nitrososphaerota archaeon]|nr:hypothetical protein [Nitrososphaerota archaeon]
MITLVNITFDKERNLIDFTIECQEDHFALTLEELDGIRRDAIRAFRT